MYKTHTPLRYSYHPHMPVAPTPQTKILFWVILLGVFAIGIIGIRIVSSAIYREETKDLPTAATVVLPAYRETIQKQTDSLKAFATAETLLAKYPDCAALQFARASQLDPNLRDAAYGWALGILTAKKDSLTTSDLADIHVAINRAEAVDPLYKPLLELKLLVAQLEKDSTVASATQSRLNALTF